MYYLYQFFQSKQPCRFNTVWPSFPLCLFDAMAGIVSQFILLKTIHIFVETVCLETFVEPPHAQHAAKIAASRK